MSRWQSSPSDSNSHVKITNKTDEPVAVFSFAYQNLAYISYYEKETIQPNDWKMLKAPSFGAGEITIGVATSIVREAGGSPVDWAVAVACVDVIEMAMMKEPRFKLHLCNVRDNTECFIVENDSLEMRIQGIGVSKSKNQTETEIEGACDTTTGILRCLQEVGKAVVTGGAYCIIKNAAKMSVKQAFKAVTKQQLKREVKKRLKKKVKNFTKKELNDEFKRRTGADMGPADFTDFISDARGRIKAVKHRDYWSAAKPGLKRVKEQAVKEAKKREKLKGTSSSRVNRANYRSNTSGSNQPRGTRDYGGTHTDSHSPHHESAEGVSPPEPRVSYFLLFWCIGTLLLSWRLGGWGWFAGLASLSIFAAGYCGAMPTILSSVAHHKPSQVSWFITILLLSNGQPVFFLFNVFLSIAAAAYYGVITCLAVKKAIRLA